MLVVPLLISCGNSDESFDGELPRRISIPHGDNVSRKVTTDGTGQKRFKEEVGAQTVIGLSSEGGPIVGDPPRARIAHRRGSDTLFVLDGEYGEVKMYRTDGTHLGAFGGPGAGPGRFESTEDIAAYRGEGSDDRIVVVSRSRRIQFFQPDKDSFTQFDRSTVSFEPRAVCSLDGTLFVHGGFVGPEALKRTDASIFKIDARGDVSDSFGPTYESEHWLVKYSLSHGVLACDRAEDTVVFAFKHSGIVYGYSRKGALKWVTEIQPFTPHPRSYDQGSMRRKEIANGDRITSIADAPGPGVIVERRQTVELASMTSYPDYTFHHYLVSSKDGRGRYLGEGDTFILDVGSGWLAGVNEHSLDKLKIIHTSPNAFASR